MSCMCGACHFRTLLSEDALEVAAKGTYERRLVIYSPENVFNRVKLWVSKHRNGSSLHCGRVKYDRGAQIDKKTLNSQKFLSCAFQKSPEYEREQEYRMVLMDRRPGMLREEYLDIVLGDCTDLMSVTELPLPVCDYIL